MAAAPRSVYQLKVVLMGSKPPIWRRLLVPDTITLPKFHSVIQVAMGWSDSHLHQFVARTGCYGPSDPECEVEWEDERRVPLARLLKEAGDALVYEYDFGDYWRHRVTLERVLPPASGVAHPTCVAGKRACPPEDVGGLPGYGAFLEAIRDPSHPDHSDCLEWVGAPFDPAAFDIREVNARLSRGRLRLM